MQVIQYSSLSRKNHVTPSNRLTVKDVLTGAGVLVMLWFTTVLLFCL